MPGAGTPDQGILESVLQRAVDLIACVFNSRVPSHNKGLAEIGLLSLSVVMNIVRQQWISKSQ